MIFMCLRNWKTQLPFFSVRLAHNISLADNTGYLDDDNYETIELQGV